MSSYRGRGRPSNFSQSWRTQRAADRPGDRDITDGLLPVPSQTLKVPKDKTLPPGDVKVENLQYLGSYNWVKGSEANPTMIVPGSPPEWQNIALPFAVPADQGKSFVDQNGHWFPSATLAPLIVAVNTQQTESGEPPFNWSAVDLVTDRNGLRKILRWIYGPTDERDMYIKDFRIDMQLAGEKTVLFNRWEKRTEEELSGFTFGFNFEKKTTVPAKDCEQSAGHHRIIQYDLNGFKIVVRFEVDACLPPMPTLSKSKIKVGNFDVDELSSTLAATSISSPSNSLTTLTSVPMGDKRTLHVGRGGSVVPQSSLIELSTRSEKRLPDLRWEESFPQLFLSQTPYHYLGVHQTGRFVQVQKRQMGKDPELLMAEKTAQTNLKKLRVVLGLIREVVVDAGEDGRLSLVCRDGNLEVYDRKSDKSRLPGFLMRQFKASV